MLSIPAPIWNRISRHAQDPGWALVFAMNGAGQERAMDRLGQLLSARGIDPVVILAYKQLAPLLAEPAAIAHFTMLNPEYRGAMPEICSIAEAMIYAGGDYWLDEGAVRQLRALLAEPLPITVYRPRQRPDMVQAAWGLEANAIAIEPADWDVARATNFAGPLLDALVDVGVDTDFKAGYRKWSVHVESNPPLLLAVEQACQRGAFASVVWREKRLATAPVALRAAFHSFMNECAPVVAALIAHVYFRVVRAERVRRAGSPNWSPKGERRAPPRRDSPAPKVAAVHFLSKAEPPSSLAYVSLEPSSFPSAIPRPPSIDSWLYQIEAPRAMKAPTSLPPMPAVATPDHSQTPLNLNKTRPLQAELPATGDPANTADGPPGNQTRIELGNLPSLPEIRPTPHEGKKRNKAMPHPWVWWLSAAAACVAVIALHEPSPMTSDQIDARIAVLRAQQFDLQAGTMEGYAMCAEMAIHSAESGQRCRDIQADISLGYQRGQESLQRQIDALQDKR